jgi:hypothetical protein
MSGFQIQTLIKSVAYVTTDGVSSWSLVLRCCWLKKNSSTSHFENAVEMPAQVAEVHLNRDDSESEGRGRPRPPWLQVTYNVFPYALSC